MEGEDISYLSDIAPTNVEDMRIPTKYMDCARDGRDFLSHTKSNCKKKNKAKKDDQKYFMSRGFCKKTFVLI